MMKLRKIIFEISSVTLGLIIVSGCTPKTDKDQRSYAVGYRLGQQLTAVQNEIDADVVARGLKDGIRQTPKLEPALLGKRLEELQMKQNEVEAGAARNRLAESRTFFASLASKPGLRVLDEGVVIEEKKPGAATVRNLKPDDEVTVRYTAKTSKGERVDETNGAGGVTIKFREINISGLRIALQKMPVGAEWTIYLAPDRAYGASGRPGLPSQSVVIYDLSLLAVGSKK